MSKENKTMHEFDLDIIVDYFLNQNRLGPGSPEVTIKALSFIENLPEDAQIVDIGCGTGGQIIDLANNTSGNIIGIDLFPKFISMFNANVRNYGLEKRVKGEVGNMEKLPFEEESLDMIWCEGAIYNIGFERGMKEWHKLLKKGGYIAVSEAAWFTEERPKEIEDFWMEAYPEIDTISVKIDQMQKSDYLPLATFILPDYCWTTNYYDPQIPLYEEFLQKHKGNKAAENLIAYQKHEAELYKRFHKYYGYVFFIGQKL